MSGPKSFDPPAGSPSVPDLELGSPAARPASAPQTQRTAGGARPAAPGAQPKAKAAPASPADYFGGAMLEGDDDQGPSLALGGGQPEQGNSVNDYFGGGSFEMDEGDAGVSLSLSDGPISAGGQPNFGAELGGGGGAFDDDFDFADDDGSGPPVVGGFSAPPAEERGPPLPSGRSPELDDVAVDPVEVTLTADYGDVPSNIVFTPQYAIRVFMRRRTLRQAVIAVQARAQEVEEQRDQLLYDLARSRKAELSASHGFASALRDLESAETLMNERSQALAGTNAEFDRQNQTFDAQIGEIEKTVQERQQLLDARRAELAEREEVCKRGHGRHQRAEIELRSAREVATRASAQGAAVPPELAARIARAEQAAETTQVDYQKVSDARAQAAQKVSAVENEIRDLRRRVASIEGEKRKFAAQMQRQIGTRSEGVGAARKSALDAGAELGRSILASKGSVPVDASTAERIREGDRDVEAALKELRKHLLALDSVDIEAEKRGRIVLGVGVVGLLVMLFMMSSGGDSKPATPSYDEGADVVEPEVIE